VRDKMMHGDEKCADVFCCRYFFATPSEALPRRFAVVRAAARRVRSDQPAQFRNKKAPTRPGLSLLEIVEISSARRQGALHTRRTYS
jgi:hypothetical protein